MKMKKEHFQHIDQALNAFVNQHREDCKKYHAMVSEKRFCWDIARAAGLIPYICRELYDYLDDDHVYTGLKYSVRNMWL